MKQVLKEKGINSDVHPESGDVVFERENEPHVLKVIFVHVTYCSYIHYVVIRHICV